MRSGNVSAFLANLSWTDPIQSDPSGAITLDGEPIAVHQIKDEIITRVAENDKLVISIESHPESRYELMVQILDEVKKAKAARISLKLRRM